MNLLVLGASGGCGKWLCRLAIERGHHIRALVRSCTSFDLPAGGEIIWGDVLDGAVLDEACAGRDAVLSALGIKRASSRNPWSTLVSPPDFTTRVMERLTRSMVAHDVRRIVAISAAGVGDSSRRLHPLIRWVIRHSNMAASYTDLEGMEAVLAGSGLDWMAVRPTTLTDGPPTGLVHPVRYYGLLTRVSRGDAANWMLDAVESSKPFTDQSVMIGS